MNISKKIMTSVLAVSMLASMAVPTYAAEENEVTDPLPNTGDTQVTLEVKDTGGSGGEEGGDEGGDGEIIAATVPVELPIVMDLKGNITVPSDAKIINHTKDSNIEVTDIDAFMEADWAAADFNSDFTAKPENAKELGLAFRGDAMGTNQKFALTDGNWVIGKNEGELQLKMEARLPRQSKQAKTKIATVQFTLDLTDKQATDDTDQPAESVISHNWGKDKVLKDSVAPVTFTYDSTASGVSIVSVESDNPAIEVEKSAQTRDLGNLKEEVWSVKAISKGAATVTATLSTGETTAFNVIVYELNIGDGGSITVPEVPNKGEGDRLNTGDIVVDIPVATPDGDDTIQITPVIPPDTVLKPGDNEIDVSAEVDGITINIKIIINIQSSNPSDGLHQSIEEAQAMGFTFSPYENGLQIDSFENKQFKSEINVPEQIGDFKVLKIGGSVFKGQTNIKKVTLPDTVKLIGASAFNGCTNLTEIKFESVEDIGAQAFFNCTKLGNITLPQSVKNIGSKVFSGAGADNAMITFQCNLPARASEDGILSESNYGNLVIDNGTVSIGANSFYRSPSLTNVKLPGSIELIDEYAFANCARLKDINIPESMISIETAAFLGCETLDNVDLPSDLRTIGKQAFQNCGLTSIIIPANVSNIGASVFANCKELVEVKWKCKTDIPNQMFMGCSNLPEMTLESSVSEIGEGAFKECEKLRKITGEGVSKVGNEAFFKCSELSQTAFGDKLRVGNSAFAWCRKLKDIPDGLISAGSLAFLRCEGLQSVRLQEGFTTVEPNTFSYCLSLESVEIPNTVTVLGERAFGTCSKLTSINLGNGLNTIGKECFDMCYNLSNVNIPSSVTQIDINAFGGLYRLENITIPDSVTTIKSNAFRDVPHIEYHGTATGAPWGAKSMN